MCFVKIPDNLIVDYDTVGSLDITHLDFDLKPYQCNNS